MNKTKEGIPILNREQLYKFLDKYKELPEYGRRSILLMGKPGVGKTEAMHRFYGSNDPNSNVNTDVFIKSANSLVATYMKHGIEPFFSNNTKQTYVPAKVIDDIGTEVIASHFGNQVELIQLLIQGLYESNTGMHFTTNLNLKELEERYGTRVIDRLKQMCFIIVLEDTNLRKPVLADNKIFAEL
jgi:DNA replication protein DnaC